MRMMPRKTAHELLCDGQWDREYGSHVPLTVPWAPQVGRDLVVLWDRLTDVVYNGRKNIMEMTWTAWVAFVMLGGMFLAILGYVVEGKRFVWPWRKIRLLEQELATTQVQLADMKKYTANLSLFLDAREKAWEAQAALRTEDLEKIEKLNSLLGMMTRRHNEARESAMVWITENSELRDGLEAARAELHDKAGKNKTTINTRKELVRTKKKSKKSSK